MKWPVSALTIQPHLGDILLEFRSRTNHFHSSARYRGPLTLTSQLFLPYSSQIAINFTHYEDTGLLARDEWWTAFRRNKPSKRRSPLAKRQSVTFHNLSVQRNRCENIEPRVLPYWLAFSTTAIKQNTPRILTVQKKFQQNVKRSGANIDVNAANDNFKFPFSLYHAVCNFETSRYIYIYIYVCVCVCYIYICVCVCVCVTH